MVADKYVFEQNDLALLRIFLRRFYFVIFVEMKKYRTSIFLSFLFILACSHADHLVEPQHEAGPSINQAINTTFKTSIQFPAPDIENADIQGNTAFSGHYCVQKTPVVCREIANNRIPVIASVLYASTDFEAKELFDNTYLSYNYPSHNFW